MSALPPASGWYFAWVDYHRKATAAQPDAVAALIVNEDIAVGTWEASYDELCECTKRLVRTFRTPKFPNEHADAVGMELVSLRAERDRAGFMVAIAPTGPGYCPMKCERGILIAPMPHLVREGKTGRALLQTIVVLCDECQQGKAEIAAQDRVEAQAGVTKDEAWKKKKLITYSTYLDRCGDIDGVAMLRQYEAERTLAARANRDEIDGLPTIKAMLGESMRVPRKDRPRGPEALP